MAARHPGDSFPIHYLQEAVSILTNDNLFPSPSWFTPFHGPEKQGSSWWHGILMCTRVLMLIHNDIFHEGLELICLTIAEDPQVGLLLIFLVKFT